MMKNIFLLAFFCLYPLSSVFSQWNNSTYSTTLSGNSGNLDASDTRGRIEIHSSLKAVDVNKNPLAIKYEDHPSIYTVDLDISSIPLDQRYHAIAGQPFTIDVRTHMYSPVVNSFQTSVSYIQAGIGQNEGPYRYDSYPYFSGTSSIWNPSTTELDQGFTRTFTFPAGRSEGWIAIPILETNQNPGVSPSEYHYTTFVLPFIIEGPMKDSVQVLGTSTQPQIPQLVIHKPPGDASSSSVLTTQKTCRSFEQSYATDETNTGRGSVKLGAAGSLGWIVTVDFEIYVEFSGSVATNNLQIRTNEKETCLEISNEISTGELTDGEPTSDVFIGYGYDYQYGIYKNLSLDGTTGFSIDSGLVYSPIDGTIRQFVYSETTIQQQITEQQALANNTSLPIKSRATAQYQADAWIKVLQLNAQNKANATEVLNPGLNFSAGPGLLYDETIEFTSTASIETSHYLEGTFAVDALVNIGGSGYSAGYQYDSRSTFGTTSSGSTANSAVIKYNLNDGDSGDIFKVDIYRDPLFGTPLFKLVENGTRSSAPYEGGYQRDQPRLEIVDVLGDTVNLNDISLGTPATFKVRVCNGNTTEQRTYDLGFVAQANSSDLLVTAAGSSGSQFGSFTIPSNTCRIQEYDVNISRRFPTSPTVLNGLEFQLYPAAEPSINSSIIANVSFATPPPPVLGSLPDPNPQRNIYVCSAIPPIPLNAICSAGTKPYWYKSETGGLPLDPIETNSILDNNAADGDEYYVSCQSPNYISPRSFFGKVTFHTNPVVITESGPLSFCAPGSVTFNSYADNNNKVLSLVRANNQYVEVPHSNSLNLSTSFTFEAWVNYSGVSVAIIDKGDYDFLWMLNANGNANKLGYYERGIGWKYSTDAVPENTWTHVALTLQGGTLKFYINGVASGSTFLSSAFQDNLPMNIGRQQPSACQCNHFNGSMDELRLWNVAKSQGEIQASMKTGVPLNSAGLVAYYKFNAASGNSVIDATNNNNDGVLINGASRQTAITVPFNELDVLWAPINTTASSFTATTSGIYTASVNYGIGCSTSVNKTVSVNSNAALVSLSSPTDDFSSNTIFKTASSLNGKIVATNKITGTAKVSYQAKALELNAGFIADSGTVFSAEIGGCQ